MQQQVLTTVSLIAVDLSPAMLFCSTNELRQSAVDSLGVQITIKVPNFFQFKSEQIIFTCVSLHRTIYGIPVIDSNYQLCTISIVRIECTTWKARSFYLYQICDVTILYKSQ